MITMFFDTTSFFNFSSFSLKKQICFAVYRKGKINKILIDFCFLKSTRRLYPQCTVCSTRWPRALARSLDSQSAQLPKRCRDCRWPHRGVSRTPFAPMMSSASCRLSPSLELFKYRASQYLFHVISNIIFL